MLALGNPACASRQIACLNGGFHGSRHRHRILRTVDRRGQQHTRAAQFHSKRGVRGGADSRIQQHRNRGAGANQLNIVRVQNAQTRADGLSERHDRRYSHIL